MASETTELQGFDLFREDLRRLLNEHDIDGLCQTPDWMLAAALADQIQSLAKIIENRELWFGRKVPSLNITSPLEEKR